ncbi:nitronate monooxygenase [Gordonia sp. (in: high G+C Gram-positive bacteria)]|uniref:nitronate monooxygenase n=1 Tax=Gordonia sp. (in: high G+C Gram-positive bacteria) TaxID=84139 RepID=UPI0039E5DA7C
MLDLTTLPVPVVGAPMAGGPSLRCPEAGTRPAHRAALTNAGFTRTVTTRAYSGRLARGLINDFIRDFTDIAPPVYPQINTLTGPLRKAAAADPQVINLWAGTGFRQAQERAAAEVVAALNPR